MLRQLLLQLCVQALEMKAMSVVGRVVSLSSASRRRFPPQRAASALARLGLQRALMAWRGVVWCGACLVSRAVAI